MLSNFVLHLEYFECYILESSVLLQIFYLFVSVFECVVSINSSCLFACVFFFFLILFPTSLVVQLLSPVLLFVIPWTAACQAFLYFTISWSLPKLMSIDMEMPSTHFILCCPLLLLPSVFPSSRVFSKELALLIRWSKYWSFSISPFNEYSGLID